jgi:hypothetical protein
VRLLFARWKTAPSVCSRKSHFDGLVGQSVRQQGFDGVRVETKVSQGVSRGDPSRVDGIKERQVNKLLRSLACSPYRVPLRAEVIIRKPPRKLLCGGGSWSRLVRSQGFIEYLLDLDIRIQTLKYVVDLSAPWITRALTPNRVDFRRTFVLDR